MGDARRRICFVLPSLDGGGAERVAVQLLNGLDAALCDRSMFLFARQGPYLSELDPAITIASADAASRWGRWRALREHVARARPEIVMVFLSYYSALSAVRAANTGAKVIFNLGTPMSAFLSDADYRWRGRWRKAAFVAATRFGYGAADLIVATSRGVADDLTANFGVDPGRIRIRANPVDLDRVRAAIAEPIDAALLPPGDAPLIVAAGRLADVKNYPLMIEAFAALRGRLPARLCILGEGQLEQPLRQMIAARDLGGSVSLAGFQRNPWQYIARADVFLLTSRYEGFGNVLIEAMGCGVPVIATASPGTRDIVTEGVDGLLVDAHTPNAIADRLFRVLSDRAYRDQLRAGAAHSAEYFGLQKVAGRYDTMLREAVA